MLYAVLPVYFEDFGLTAIQVGILLSANRWIRLVTNHVAHVASFHVRPRTLLLAALSFGTLTTLGYAFTSSFTVLVLARVLWGIAWSFIRHVGVLEVMAHTPVEAAGRTMGLYNGISRAGTVTGLLGGAALVDAFGLTAAVVALAGTSAVSIVLVLRDQGLLRSTARVHAAAARTGDARGHVVFAVLGFSLGIVGGGFVISTLGLVLEPYADEVTLVPGLTAATLTGALLAIRFVLDSAAAPWLGAITDRFGIRPAATAFFLIGGVALVAASTQPPSLLGMGTLMMAFFVASTSLHSGVAASVSRHGSGAYARYVTAADVGSAAGPLLGWVAVDLLDFAAVGFVMGAVFYLVSAGMAFRLLRNDQPVPDGSKR